MEYFRKRFENYLDTDYPVNIAGQVFPTASVFKTMAAHDYEAHFVDWIGERKVEAKERAYEFLTKYGSLKRFNAMFDRFRSRQILPFVGAGMSYASGYPLWGPFLLDLLEDFPDKMAEVKSDLDYGKYEEAAQKILDTLGSDALSEQIHNTMGRFIKKVNGPVCCLPELFNAEVITTNFDYVLDHVYDEANSNFSEKFRGSQLRQAVQRLGDVPHSLLRLHGEADTHEDRVLTRSEYDAAYQDSAAFESTLGRLLGIRSVLFLGCSLVTDRVFEAFRSIKITSGDHPTRHYAFLPFPGDKARGMRLTQLSSASIYPIYYPPGQHDKSIEDLLITMVEGGF